MLRIVALFLTALVAASCASLRQPAEGWVLPDTRVMAFKSADGVHDMKLLIGLPRNYATRTESFPVIYLLDADYSFPLAQDVLRHFTDRGQLKEAITVGLAYPGADKDLDIYRLTRTRDYTPTNTPDGGYSTEIQKLSGGADRFLDMLQNELMPIVDREFRTDPSARMIVGHSFGGLLAAHTMVTRPDLFRDYLIVSPSLWYDHKTVFKTAQTYIASHRELKARVFWSIGSFENHKDSNMMIDDMQAFDDLLKRAHLADYSSSLQVFDGDTHNSIFPAALTRGLRVLDEFAGEAAGNALEKH